MWTAVWSSNYSTPTTGNPSHPHPWGKCVSAWPHSIHPPQKIKALKFKHLQELKHVLPKDFYPFYDALDHEWWSAQIAQTITYTPLLNIIYLFIDKSSVVFLTTYINVLLINVLMKCFISWVLTSNCLCACLKMTWYYLLNSWNSYLPIWQERHD